MAAQSSSIRNLKAKLQILRRPGFWGSAILLALPLIFLFDYWNNPEKFSFKSDQPLPDSTTGADTNSEFPAISDASTVLDIPVPPTEGTPTDLDTPLRQTDFLSALLSNSLSAERKSTEDKSASRSTLRSSSQSQQAPKINFSNAFAPLSSVSEQSGLTTTTSSTNQTSATAPVNPLQSALDRNAGVNQTDSGNPLESQTTGQTQSTAQTAGTTPVSPYGIPSAASTNRSTFSQPSGFQPYIPQTSPAPGTTGYTLPPAFRTTTNTPTGSFYLNPSTGYGVPAVPQAVPQIAPTVPTQPIPGSYGSYSSPYGTTPGYSSAVPAYPMPTYTNPQSSQAAPAPFSIPRNPPGQYIGGGEINTFSNP